MKARFVHRSMLLAGLTLSLGACAWTDPLQREGLWHPTGVNNANLAVMVVNPHDLVAGRGTTTSDATLAAAAVDRLYRDKVKALPDTGLVLAGVGNAAAGGGAAGAAADATP
jgi:type IV pilus biogenesis protein CpaD/CtpE